MGPADSATCDCENSNTGPGLHIAVATGNVWTKVPVARVQLFDGPSLDFYLRFDSLFSTGWNGDDHDRSQYRNTVLGKGWTHSYNGYAIQHNSWPGGGLMLITRDGLRRAFNDVGGNGAWASYSEATFVDPDYRIDYPDGTQEFYEFVAIADRPDYFATIAPNSSNDVYRLARILDRRGRETLLTYDDETGGGLLESVRDAYGRLLILEYKLDTELIEYIHLPDDGVVHLTYDSQGRLSAIEDPEGHSRSYLYDSSNRITREILRNGVTYWVTYEQDAELRRVTIKDADSNGNPDDVITTVEVTGDEETPMIWDTETPPCEPLECDENHPTLEQCCVPPEPLPYWCLYCVKRSQLMTASGQPNDTGEVRRIDGEGHVWTHQIDRWGRVKSVESPTDTNDNTNRNVTYGYSHFPSRITSKKVGNSQPTLYGLDVAKGQVNKITDPLGNVTNLEYHSASGPPYKLFKKTQPDGDYWQYGYTGGDLEDEDFFTSNGEHPQSIHHEYFDYQGGLPGRIETKITTDAYGRMVTLNFNAEGTLASKLVETGEGDDLLTEYTYDDMARLKSVSEHRDGSVVHKTSYDYDDAGNLVRETVDPESLELITDYEVDGEGLVTGVTDPRGVVTKYKYDQRNRLRKRTADAGTGRLNLATHLEYDLADNLTKIIDPKGHATEIEYYNFNLPRRVVDTIGQATMETLVLWDRNGKLRDVKRQREPGSAEYYQVTLFHDDLSRLTGVVLDPEGLSLATSFAYEDPMGAGCGCSATPGTPLVNARFDAAGKATYYKYDWGDRLVRMVRKVGEDDGPEPDADDVVTQLVRDDEAHTIELINPESESRLYSFDLANRLISRFVQTDGQGNGLLTSYTFDSNGPLKTITLPNGNVITLGYDNANRRTSAADAIGAIDALTWDPAGNLLTWADGEGNLTSNGYDGADRLAKVKDPAGNLEFYDYDENGNLLLFTDREGRKAQYTYDELDRLTTMLEDLDGLRRKSAYTFDGLNRAMTLTAYVGTNGTGTEQTTTYKYDPAARLDKVIYPDDDANSNGVVRYTWTEVGRLKTRTDQKDIVTTYGYDDLHRLTSRLYSDGITPAEAFHYDKAGRLDAASNGVTALGLEYDDGGRLTDVDQLVNSVTYHTDLIPEVSETLNRLTMLYPGQSTGVVKNFDLGNRPESIAFGQRDLIASTVYDLADRPTQRTLGNGVISGYIWDENSWLTLIDHVKEAVSLEKIGYGYDKVGNVKYRDVQTPGLERMSELYDYDDLHRLRGVEREVLNQDKTAVTTPIGKPFVQSQAWTSLDMLGNWIESSSAVGGQPSADSRAINNVNEYLTRQVNGGSVIDLVSDDNGNLTDDGNQKYDYDGENRLIRVRRKSDDAIIQEYAYDPLGRRVKTVDRSSGILPEYPNGKTTTHVYAGGPECLVEYDSTAAEGGTRERWFIHGRGFPDPLVMVDLTSNGDQPASEEEYLYYLKDLLGSVTALANSNGEVVERYVYDPYGRTTVTYPDGTVQLPPLSKSYYHDADLDGDVDEDDQQHLEDCANSIPFDPTCVFVHDRNGNNEVDSQDMGMFAQCEGGSQPCAPRPPTAFFDCNGNHELDAFDWLAFHTCLGATAEPSATLCKFVFDIDRDDDVDLDDYAEFQRAYGGPGVPRPAASVTTGGSRFCNPLAWTGQRYDAALGLYHFKYRSYSPSLGRWLQRDPLGYVDGASLLEYTISAPTSWNDPLGLELVVKGKDSFQEQIENAIKVLVPSARVDPDTGEVGIEKPGEKSDPNKKPGKAEEILETIITSDEKIEIEREKRDSIHYDRDTKSVKAPDSIHEKTDTDQCEERSPDYWEALWHELVHVHGDVTHTYDETVNRLRLRGQEEIRTIRVTNEIMYRHG